MIGVDENDLVVFVDTILVHPVAVQDSQISASTSNSLLCDAAQAALELEVVDTLANGLAVCRTLGDGLFAVATTDTDAVDDVALLGLVAQAASLVGARGARGTVDYGELTVLPAPFIVESNIR